MTKRLKDVSESNETSNIIAIMAIKAIIAITIRVSQTDRRTKDRPTSTPLPSSATRIPSSAVISRTALTSGKRRRPR